MTAAPVPPDEPSRLSALRALDVLDTSPEPEFDALVQAAAALCGTPVSLISLVDAGRQWFKASHGLSGVRQTPRDIAFCAHAILDDGVFVVPNALLDERFAANPLVTHEPAIRFYAGATLKLSDGAHVGTLCVMDRVPRQLDARQRQVLALLASAAAQALEGRRALLHERALREAAWHAQALLRNSRDAILALTLDGIVTHWNDAAQQLFGWSADERVGQPLDPLLPPGDAAPERQPGTLLARHPRGLTYDAQRLDCTGEPIAVSVSLAPITDGTGRLVGATKIIRDMRAQVRAAQTLARNEARFRLLSEGSPLGLCSTDADGRCSYANERWHALFDLPPQAPADEWRDRVHPDDRAELLAAWQAASRDGQPFDRRFRIGTTTSGVRHLRLRLRPVADGSAGHVGAVEDITEHRHRLDRLAAEGDAAQRLYESTPAMLHSIDREGRLLSVSDHWLAALGWTRGEVLGRRWTEFLTPCSRAEAEAFLPGFFGDGQCSELPLQLLRRDGAVRDVLLSAVLERDADGRALRSMAVLRDVTEQLRAERALAAAHERIALATDSGGIGVWEYTLADDTLRWDAWMCRLYGVAPGAPGPRFGDWVRRVHPDDRDAAAATLRHAIADAGTQVYEDEFRVVHDDGSVHHLRSTARLSRDEQGRATRMIGVNWDVSDLRRLSVELAEQHELLQVTLKSIGDAVITTDAQAVVSWMNPVAERMTGCTLDTALGRPLPEVFRLVGDATQAPLPDPVAACLAQRRVVESAEPARLLARDGATWGIEESAAPILDARGRVLGAVLVFHDVTEQRRLSGEMRWRATHDALTGLVNRTEFEARLRRALVRAHEDGSEHALMFIDLDQFKLVNDACGHSAGDQLLQQVARLLGETVRSRDTLARLGGDEFAVILEHCTVPQASRVAEQICQRMEDYRFQHDERRFRIGASIGLAPLDRRWRDAAALMQAADSACYAAKEAGRNRVHAWFDTDQAIRTRHGEMQWATRLEEALDEDSFVLYAQRIEPTAPDAHGLHAEVLVRLADGEGTLAPPGAFLPAAERFHLASRLDRWVLRRTLVTMAALDDLARIGTLCVNLSGQSVGDRAFHRQAIELLHEAGPAICRRLCLEITETAAVTNMADAAAFIGEVRALGVRVALDDFGAGASSFGYLKTLKVDLLKIDGQFIKDLIDDPLDDAAVRCFVDVARVVGVRTVAEFVDTPAVLERVREIGIHYAQGYLLHRPEALERVLARAGLPSAARTPAIGESDNTFA